MTASSARTSASSNSFRKDFFKQLFGFCFGDLLMHHSPRMFELDQPASQFA